MAGQTIRIAVIIASSRANRFGGVVARWFLELAGGYPDMLLDVVDLRETNLPAVLPVEPDAAVNRYRERVEAADGFVVIVPEYNHGYPASLKQAIDLANHQWRAKPVAFVSYGGMSGGIRAVEQLRQVFAELHVVGLRDGVSFHRARKLFDEQGRLIDSQYATEVGMRMLDRLRWWALSLKEARLKRPYAP